MSSYAQVTSHNASGPQPRPDPALLNTQPSSDTALPDVDHKVTVVPSDYRSNPETITSANAPHIEQVEKDAATKAKSARKAARSKFQQAEKEAMSLWEQVNDRVMRPGILGGILGIVNVGVLGTFGYQLYYKPQLRTDTRFLTTASVSTLLLFGTEGFVAESYRKTAAGQEEERRAREEGAAIYRQTKELVLRPGVLGGLVGIVNLGILGGVGYAAYSNWDRPSWDRRTVSIVTVGLLTLFTGEGYLAERYREEGYPRRK